MSLPDRVCIHNGFPYLVVSKDEWNELYGALLPYHRWCSSALGEQGEVALAVWVVQNEDRTKAAIDRHNGEVDRLAGEDT